MYTIHTVVCTLACIVWDCVNLKTLFKGIRFKIVSITPMAVLYKTLNVTLVIMGLTCII